MVKKAVDDAFREHRDQEGVAKAKIEPTKGKPTEKLELEPAKENIEEEISDEKLRELVGEVEANTGEIYDCPKCGHKENVPFNPCPQCGKQLSWD